MFTGIIAGLGSLKQVEPVAGDARYLIDCSSLPAARPELGESIAVNGVCLTAQEWVGNAFWADLSAETLALTTLGGLQVGDEVNLERALQASDRLGGHMVSGHVDGLAEIISMEDDARSRRFDIRAPQDLSQYIARKGSVTLDGVSLTVNSVDGDSFSVNIVPHTMEMTIISDWQPGRQINLEVDVVARYLERLLAAQATIPG